MFPPLRSKGLSCVVGLGVVIYFKVFSYRNGRGLIVDGSDVVVTLGISTMWIPIMSLARLASL